MRRYSSSWFHAYLEMNIAQANHSLSNPPGLYCVCSNLQVVIPSLPVRKEYTKEAEEEKIEARRFGFLCKNISYDDLFFVKTGNSA